MKIDQASVLKEIVAAPNPIPFINVKAIVGGYDPPADAYVRNLFANSDEEGMLKNLNPTIDMQFTFKIWH